MTKSINERIADWNARAAAIRQSGGIARRQESWSDGWKDRIVDAIGKQGSPNIFAWLAERPALTYPQLADRFSFQVAPVQLVMLQMRDANTTALRRVCAADMLVRDLNEFLPDGWSDDEAAVNGRSSAYARWATDLKVREPRIDVDAQVTSTFSSLKGLQPPKGWKPLNPNDNLIQEAFRTGWPEEVPLHGRAGT